MTLADRIIAEAREWVGTPFHWQASVKGVGCDCKGLVWGVARELGLPEAETIYAKVADYGKRVPVKLLQEGMAAVFDRVEEPQPGDVLLLKLRNVPMHLAIVTGPDTAVHAQIAPTDKIKETDLPALLRKHPIDSIWRWRDGN
jgi:NlpC/P60 family putative phage cell wall peptidase